MERKQEVILGSVLEVISASNEFKDIGGLREKVIDVFYNTISSDGAIFFLSEQNKSPGNILLKNLDKKYIDPYLSYFRRLDPFRLERLKNKTHNTCLSQYIENFDFFQNTNYYNDFLKPQKIHYKLIINLEIEGKSQGRVVLTRSKKRPSFNLDEVRTAMLISPYLAHSLFHFKLKSKIKLFEHIIDYLEKQSHLAMILLDNKLKVIHVNRKAEDFMAEINSLGPGNLKSNFINPSLFEDCLIMQSRIRKLSRKDIGFSMQRVIEGPFKKSFRVRSKVFDPELDLDIPYLFVINIEEFPGKNQTKWQHLMKSFSLSPREIEVVPHIFSGLKNAEIAQKLFVSEVTIKKHLQNIYIKMGVKNRTSLMNKVLSLNSSSVFTA